MSQDIGRHPFKPFPKWHAYYVERKCAECFHVRAFELHKPEPPQRPPVPEVQP